ncbi:acyltransferase [uncultured Massilia sp.]|uniref:acyltransferase family protein n=1 Tax=uncultured Massilia sp. TaxID=169973 RepID=UPI0025FC54A9|nr:acyltransferase [uncultured Massilia sp.]
MTTRAVGRAIPPHLSLYLDLVRFAAALFVVLYHTWSLTFPDRPFKWPGHEAVVVFFVLSGYVIAHAATAPGMTFGLYLQHRIARIVPVAWTALLLALAACLLWPGLPGAESLGWGTLSNALFIAQSGPFAVAAPLNPPFWSLNYEVWYYAIFGAWLFAPARWRVALVLAACLLAGPKILLLLPVWLLGVLLYRRMPAWKPALAWTCLLASVAIGVLMTWLDVSDVLRAHLYALVPFAWRAHYSTQFLYDNLLGLVVAMHFAAVSSLGWLPRLVERAARPIRWLAGCTFTLYVFHGPLLVLIRDVAGIAAPLPFYAAMALGVLVAAELTERRVKWYRGRIAALQGRWRRPRAPAIAAADVTDPDVPQQH